MSSITVFRRFCTLIISVVVLLAAGCGSEGDSRPETIETPCEPACGSSEICDQGICVAAQGCDAPCDPGEVCEAGSCVDAASCLAAGESADPDGSYELPELEESSVPDHQGIIMQEHMAALALVSYDQATHVAVRDGAWCNPDTWHNKSIPGDGARVVIADGVAVAYAMVDDARLETVRVDGHLEFSSTASSRMVVDTLYVDVRGTLVIGTAANPVRPDVSVEVVFPDVGDIDVTWDPMLLSRGVISHGVSEIHGAQKTTHLKVASDPKAGDEALAMASAPTNWRAGDTIVVGGTRYSGWKWSNDAEASVYHGSQDEVRTITEVDGDTIHLDSPLEFDHVSPREDLKARVANFTRNVSFATENGADLPPHRRGHFMVMHSPKADIRYAEFRHLGRTDKSVESFDVENVSPVQPDSNVRGRYSLHFHRTGVDAPRDPALAVGNAVFTSPGWGYVHHDSNADFYDNASFDTFGAGFVAETGNEIGTWVDNIAIHSGGNGAFNPKNGIDREAFDIGRTGTGFWFQGRMVESIDNVAVSTTQGFVYFHRGTGMLEFSPEVFMLPEALGYTGTAGADDVPIRDFDGNEAIASTVGLFVVKANPNQGHDIYTVLSDFTAWEVTAGANIEYTSHYLLRDFDLVASTPERFRNPGVGIVFGNNSTDMVIRNATIEGFRQGIHLSKHHTNDENLGKDQYVLIANEFIDVDEELPEWDGDRPLFEPGVDTVIDDESALVEGRMEIDLPGPHEYLSPATAWESCFVERTGTKTDSIGSNPLPAGTEKFRLGCMDMIGQLEQDGYYRDREGTPYAVIEWYFSDRATGEIHKVGVPTVLGPEVESAITSDFGSWSNSVEAGTIDLDSAAPVANADTASTTPGARVVIDLLANDSDPDGDPLTIDGIVQPKRGEVFDNGDGTVTYSPDLFHRGTESFYYWVTDRNGHFIKAYVTVDVDPSH